MRRRWEQFHPTPPPRRARTPASIYQNRWSAVLTRQHSAAPASRVDKRAAARPTRAAEAEPSLFFDPGCSNQLMDPTSSEDAPRGTLTQEEARHRPRDRFRVCRLQYDGTKRNFACGAQNSRLVPRIMTQFLKTTHRPCCEQFSGGNYFLYPCAKSKRRTP